MAELGQTTMSHSFYLQEIEKNPFEIVGTLLWKNLQF